jgi:MarR family transcriptional regulator, 2-MHQ and catechol-resistance regulon repressor
MKSPADTRSLALREDPRLERDAHDLHTALAELIRIYQFRDRERICCYDLSVTQYHALQVLAEAGPVSMNELAARLFLDKSTTSRVVDALERKEYAVRRPNPADRRALLLDPTERGAALVARIGGEILVEEKRLLGEFEPALRREMTRLITRLARAAAARIDTSGGTCSSID